MDREYYGREKNVWGIMRRVWKKITIAPTILPYITILNIYIHIRLEEKL